MAKLLLIEHNNSLATLIHQVLHCEPKLRLVGHASNAYQAIQFILETRPDLILIDAPLPDIGFSEIISLTRELAPTSRIILLIDDWGARYLNAAIRYGVSACITKDRLATDLIPVAQRLIHIPLVEAQYGLANVVETG